MFGLREKIRILRAHVAELEILVKHGHACEGQITDGKPIDLGARPVDLGAILLFNLRRFDFDFHTLHVIERAVVKPNSKEEQL